MTEHRFFVAPDEMAGDRFPLPASIAHQVRRVLRLGAGDELVVLDGRGALARCRLGPDATAVEVVERGPAGGEPRHRLVVGQALIKGDGLETVVRQGTELGVTAFRLLLTRRSVSRALSPRRLERLRSIAREAAEQSERGIVPEVSEPASLATAFEPGAVLLYERAEAGIPRLGELPPPAMVLVGPEGGFTPDEVADARDAGVLLAGLGPRILRSESVALAAASTILARTGDFA